MTDFKIFPGLRASDFLVTDEGHSYRIWLWEDQSDLIRWAKRYAVDADRCPGKFEYALGLHNPAEVMLDGKSQHLGDIHFVVNMWDLEKIAHECTHALFHMIRYLVSDFPRRLYLWDIESEEKICYPFGELVGQAYRWLWKKNPNPRWQKKN